MPTYRTGVGVYAFQNMGFGHIGSMSDVASQVTGAVTSQPHVPLLLEYARVLDPLDLDTLIRLRPINGGQDTPVPPVTPTGRRRRTLKGAGH